MTINSFELPFGPLDSQCAEIRLKHIHWQALFDQGIISADEMTIMNELSFGRNWGDLMAKGDSQYISTPIAVLEKVGSDDATIACLTVLYDLLLQYYTCLESFIKASNLDLTPLTHCLDSTNEIIAGLAARDLAVIARIKKNLSIEDASMLVKWVGSSLMVGTGDNEPRILLGTLLLEHILQVAALRARFFGNTEYIKRLVGPLLKSRNVQIQYQTMFALWLLTFDAQIARELQLRCSVIIPLLLDVAKGAIKEKILRICISTWRNLLSQTPSLALPVMIGAKVLDYLESLGGGRITDEEACADVAILKEELVKAIQSLNSYDEYSSEVKSGKLDWSPPHKSELFWRDNAARLAENDCELLRQLVKLLDTSHFDPKIVAISAYDLGMYIEFHTAGRKNVERIGGKQKIMALITFSDPEVRFQALSTMQKYMKKLWNPA